MTVAENTRNRIVENAVKVFMEQGIQGTKMEDIAVAADIARRTLYRYFPSKDALAIVVVTNMLRDFNSYQNQLTRNTSGTGLEQLKSYLYDLVGYFDNHKDIMCLLGEFDYFYSSDLNTYDTTPEALEAFQDSSHTTEDYLEMYIKKGMEDGSIALHKDLHLTVLTISNVLWGFGQHAALREDSIRAEFNTEAIDLIYCQVDMYIEGLKKK